MAVTLSQFHSMEIGTVIKKGNRKRIYRGMGGFFAYYSTPSKPNEVTGVSLSNFRKWLLEAEIVSS